MVPSDIRSFILYFLFTEYSLNNEDLDVSLIKLGFSSLNIILLISRIESLTGCQLSEGYNLSDVMTINLIVEKFMKEEVRV